MLINWMEYDVCESCLVAAANDDYTGLTDDEERAVRSGLHALGETVADGEDLGFSWRRCECCDALPGHRYRLLVRVPYNDSKPEKTNGTRCL